MSNRCTQISISGEPSRSATVRATRSNGRKAYVRLKLGDEVVDETELQVNSDDWRREIRLSHTPTNIVDSATEAPEEGERAATQAVASYTIEASFASADEGAADGAQDGAPQELFADNNSWSFDVAVSDDRTAVLLVDSRPRWEFRYLRNLFYGRDKSIHLQYLLTEPDRIGGIDAVEPLPPASASRPFGDAEAGALPVDADEWRKFDVIILGDVGPDLITPEVSAQISECVSDRGALLVVIAGPRSMPHASGRLHPVMRQSASMLESEAIWAGIPDMRWRFQGMGAKPGAEVLAFAESAGRDPGDLAEITAGDAAARLDAEDMRRRRDALVVARNYGRGRVLVLNFDQTWRMRYLAGDRLHHRFWGQVVRWGVGEKLRAGRDELRVGTDRLSYAPGDAPQVFGRVTDADFMPVEDARIVARLLAPDGSLAAETPLSPREGGQGLYDGEFPPLATNGTYRVELRRDDAPDIQPARTLLMSVSARRPAERSDVSASREVPGMIARWTGGRVVSPEEADSLAEGFGEGRRDIDETVSEPLWNHPAWFAALVALLVAEWMVRRRNGLV